MLFDLERDPGQMTNLAERPEFALEIERHRALLAEWVDRIDDRIGRDYAVPGSPRSAQARPLTSGVM